MNDKTTSGKNILKPKSRCSSYWSKARVREDKSDIILNLKLFIWTVQTTVNPAWCHFKKILKQIKEKIQNTVVSASTMENSATKEMTSKNFKTSVLKVWEKMVLTGFSQSSIPIW